MKVLENVPLVQNLLKFFTVQKSENYIDILVDIWENIFEYAEGN